ncbi:MAG TPA: heme-binding protein, partial [Chthoniobacterales bacterium]|nr:heme-binding protein [Chthoniobacterales bacterium]
ASPVRARALSFVALVALCPAVAIAQLTAVDVQTIIDRATTRAVQISPNSVIAVTDREGDVLAVWSVNGTPPTALEISSCVSKAGTAAFLSSNQNAFTSRTAGFIIQQHFPPGVRNTPPGPLVGVGLSNLFSSDINKFRAPGSVVSFSATPGLTIVPVFGTSLDGSPGGLPLYKAGKLVGGIGVTGDGVPGPVVFRSQNPFTFIGDYDKDEDVALAGQTGFRPSRSILADNVYINGIALPYVLSSTPPLTGIISQGAAAPGFPVMGTPPPFPYPIATFGGVQGEIRQPIISDPISTPINGQPRLTAAEVASIINFAAARARTTRAGIRLPIGVPMQVFITVVNFPNSPTVPPTCLGAFRTGEATLFSWDVAVQKGRTAVGFSNNSLALSTRTVGFLAQTKYPPGLDVQDPGPYFGLQEQFSGFNRAALPNFVLDPSGLDPRFPNGITIFPGGFPLYRNGQLIGAIGISGDGVDQDDIVGASGTHDFLAPFPIRADQFAYLGARLPYAKFPRDPDGTDGSVEYPPFTVAAEKLANISTRVNAGTGDSRLIGGFIVTGKESKKVIVRAMGPSLFNYGVTGALADPTLELHDGTGAVIAINDNWADTQAAEIAGTGLAPGHPLESAIVRTLAPGAYTALVDTRNGGTGTALVEVFDLSQNANSTLGNISTRGAVGPQSDVIIGGFIINGTTGSTRVLIRSAGPSLVAAGVIGAMPDPTLELRDIYGTLIATNDNWREGPELEIEQTGLAPANDLESAIITTLPSGPYTAVIHERTGQTGIGLFEVYNLQNP